MTDTNTNSHAAFAEAIANVRAAEHLFNASEIDKARAANDIAQTWVGIGNGLHIAEATRRWDASRSNNLDDLVPQHQTITHTHVASCMHYWLDNLTDTKYRCRCCQAEHTPDVDRHLCPNRCVQAAYELGLKRAARSVAT